MVLGFWHTGMWGSTWLVTALPIIVRLHYHTRRTIKRSEEGCICCENTLYNPILLGNSYIKSLFNGYKDS